MHWTVENGEKIQIWTAFLVLIEVQLILNFSLSFELIVLEYKWSWSTEIKLLIICSPVPPSFYLHVSLFTLPSSTPFFSSISAFPRCFTSPSHPHIILFCLPPPTASVHPSSSCITPSVPVSPQVMHKQRAVSAPEELCDSDGGLPPGLDPPNTSQHTSPSPCHPGPTGRTMKWCILRCVWISRSSFFSPLP